MYRRIKGKQTSRKRGRPKKGAISSSSPANSGRYPEGYLRLVAFGDRHFPHTLECSDRIILRLIEDLQPHFIVDGGDPICAAQLSSFPKTHAELIGLQNELDGDFSWRKSIAKVSPDSQKILLRDNHFTKRLMKRISENPWLEDLRFMSEDSMFSAKELGWQILSRWIWKDLLMFIHGDGQGVSSPRLPVNRARAMVKDHGISVVRFHSHCTGFELHRRHDGNLLHAIQLGCLEDPEEVSYIDHPQINNWTHSLGVFYLSEKPPYHFFFVPCIISHSRCIFNNTVYE